VSLRVFERQLRGAGLWDEALIDAWERQVESNTFSPAVQGLGTLRVAGRSGDAALQFPQVTSLAVLDQPDTVNPAERYMLRVMQLIVEAAPTANRTAFKVVPAEIDGEPPKTDRLTTLDTMANDIMIVTRVVGG
jgi:hypothetical protein